MGTFTFLNTQTRLTSQYSLVLSPIKDNIFDKERLRNTQLKKVQVSRFIDKKHGIIFKEHQK